MARPKGRDKAHDVMCAKIFYRYIVYLLHMYLIAALKCYIIIYVNQVDAFYHGNLVFYMR